MSTLQSHIPNFLFLFEFFWSLPCLRTDDDDDVENNLRFPETTNISWIAEVEICCDYHTFTRVRRLWKRCFSFSNYKKNQILTKGESEIKQIDIPSEPAALAINCVHHQRRRRKHHVLQGFTFSISIELLHRFQCSHQSKELQNDMFTNWGHCCLLNFV